MVLTTPTLRWYRANNVCGASLADSTHGAADVCPTPADSVSSTSPQQSRTPLAEDLRQLDVQSLITCLQLGGVDLATRWW